MVDPGDDLDAAGRERLDAALARSWAQARAGQTRPAEELLERVWDEAADPFTSTVKVTIRRLRSKLGDPPLIETVPHSGYRI